MEPATTAPALSQPHESVEQFFLKLDHANLLTLPGHPLRAAAEETFDR